MQCIVPRFSSRLFTQKTNLGNTYDSRGGVGRFTKNSMRMRIIKLSHTELPVTLLVRALSGWSCRLSLVLRRLTDSSTLCSRGKPGANARSSFSHELLKRLCICVLQLCVPFHPSGCLMPRPHPPYERVGHETRDELAWY